MFEGMKTILKRIGIDPRALYEKPGSLSINLASSGGHKEMVSRLRSIVPVISAQEEGGRALFNSYWELKRRSLHAFQCGLMIRALEGIRPRRRSGAGKRGADQERGDGHSVGAPSCAFLAKGTAAATQAPAAARLMAG